jgi:hypothetical protein
MKTMIAALLLTLSTTAVAQYNPYGNVYNKSGNTVYGSNANTGSTWQSTTTGSETYGTNAKGQNYEYNAQTHYYHNDSTGKTCTGTGVYRVCN